MIFDFRNSYPFVLIQWKQCEQVSDLDFQFLTLVFAQLFLVDRSNFLLLDY